MNWHIGKLGSSGFLFLALAYLLSQDANASSENPEELFDECVGVAGKSFCDFLFKRGNSPTNVTSLPDSRLESINNTDSSSLSNSTYVTYNDNDNGFSIQHPSDWFPGYHNTEYGTVIGFSPVEEERAYVDVRVNPKGDFKSLKEYGDYFKESDQLNLLAYYRNSTTELGGKPAFRAVYLLTLSTTFAESLQGIKPEPGKGLFIGTMVPEKKSLYSIVYLADPQVFDKYLPEVEKMVDSFNIFSKGPVIQEDNEDNSTSASKSTPNID